MALVEQTELMLNSWILAEIALKREIIYGISRIGTVYKKLLYAE